MSRDSPPNCPPGPGHFRGILTTIFLYVFFVYLRDGPTTTTTTTIIFQKSFASDATPKQHLMAHQMKNLCGFSVFHCVEGAFGASSGGTPEMKMGPPRDGLKNGRGRGWAGPYYRFLSLSRLLWMARRTSDFLFPYTPPPPPSRQSPQPPHPRELDFGPFWVRFGPFRVHSLSFFSLGLFISLVIFVALDFLGFECFLLILQGFFRVRRVGQMLDVSVEPKVRLEGYGYNPFCSHSSRCLAVLVWQYFEEALCTPKVRLKWYGFKGFPSHSSHCSGAFFHSTPGSAQCFRGFPWFIKKIKEKKDRVWARLGSFRVLFWVRFGVLGGVGERPHIARYCDTIAAIPHIARYFLREASRTPKMVRYPPLVLSFTQAYLCDTQFCNVSRENCAIPHKSKHERVSRYYRYEKYRAIWKVSLLGL